MRRPARDPRPPCAAVVCVHGIGDQAPGWSHALLAGVAARAPGPVVWAEATWARVTGDRTDAMHARVTAGLGAQRLRGFVFRLGGDVLAYAPTAPVWPPTPAVVGYPGEDVHTTVHRVLDAAVADVRGELAVCGAPDAPVVLVGHSLGSVIAADWLASGARGSSGRTARTVDGLVTLGSPLPITAAALLHHAPPPVPRWLNLFDPDDPVGHPLGRISPAYAAVVRDVAVRNTRGVGGWLTRHRPVTGPLRAHCDYWLNPQVHAAIAGELHALAAPAPVGRPPRVPAVAAPALSFVQAALRASGRGVVA